jgi:hypothetical protein
MSRATLESSAKITAGHLARLAYVYVRQSFRGRPGSPARGWWC